MHIKQHGDDYSYYFGLEKEESHPVGRAGQQRGDHHNDFFFKCVFECFP